MTTSALKRELRSACGRLVFQSGLHRRLLRDRAYILLFHRVDDRFPGDPITCSRREFSGYCDFVARHFTVIGLGELLRKHEAGEDLSGHLVITFDDGYRDNRDAAAAELERRGLPACFFIASAFIGSRTVPWWDARLPVAPAWMDWDDVRDLHARGFELGAHTMHHVDLGVVAGADAEREIVGSRERLERETGVLTPFFSYPYGRRHQISEDNRELVRRAGFACCLSAYGGDIRPDADRFRLQRTPVSPWFTSPQHLGLELVRG
ncbi:MAG TPA: polysaccharide deacetylase family protein [Gemmatimonadales bacterium]|nr:polysaccharide deacetylase family protein [Gemmatimonadales bacterium]